MGRDEAWGPTDEDIPVSIDEEVPIYIDRDFGGDWSVSLVQLASHDVGGLGGHVGRG